MKVSIALCTWNGERHLEAQLGSILDQERLPDELVLRDDGSNDRTLELARDILAGSPFRVDVAANPSNLGSTANFESALSACNGDILLPCDQDDVWHPDKIRRCVEVLEGSGADLVFHDARLVDVDLEPIGGLWSTLGLDTRRLEGFARSDSVFPTLLRQPHVTGCCLAVRSEAFRSCLPIGRRWVHDEWLALALAARGGRLVPLDERLIDYRQHPVQQLGMHQTRWRWKMGRIFEADAGAYAQEVEKLGEMASYLRAGGASTQAALELLEERIFHGSARSRMGALGFRKGAGSIWSEWRSGRYARHSWWKAAPFKDVLRLVASSWSGGRENG